MNNRHLQAAAADPTNRGASIQRLLFVADAAVAFCLDGLSPASSA